MSDITDKMVSKFLSQFEASIKTNKVLSSSNIYVDSTSGFDVGSVIVLGSLTRWERVKRFLGLYQQESYEILSKTESYLQITPVFKKPTKVIALWSRLARPKGDTVKFKRPSAYVI